MIKESKNLNTSIIMFNQKTHGPSAQHLAFIKTSHVHSQVQTMLMKHVEHAQITCFQFT